MGALFNHEDFFNHLRHLLDEEGNLLEEKDVVLKPLPAPQEEAVWWAGGLQTSKSLPLSLAYREIL